ncbi:MAG: hypothetical protein WC756_10865 [Taibaiella sp.]|jgi:YD repeat-containing protein
MGGGSIDNKLNPALGNNVSIGNIFSPSLYNGTANINIPIYAFDDYGVSLSYNTAGIPVKELAGAVGLHWNLNASGFIQRQMKDMPDEMNTNPNIPLFPGGGSPAPGNGFTIYTSGVKGKFAQYFGVAPATENAQRYVDQESDDFIFSVGSLSFTFNIGADGFVFTHPHENIKIQLLVDGLAVTQLPVQPYQNMTNLSFIVTDAQGNRYYFIEGEMRIQKIYEGGRNSDTDYPLFEFNYISKWVIQKVVRSDGSEINYEYSTSDFLSGRGLMFNAYSGLERLNNPASVSSQAVAVSEGVYIDKHLSAIKYPNNVTASFIYRPIDRCDYADSILQEIKIASDERCIRYAMKQAYTISPYSGNPNLPAEVPVTSPCTSIGPWVENRLYHRLILKGIDMLSCDGSVTEPYYTFEYDPMRLPARSSGAEDYFGYYNGQQITANNGELNIPAHTAMYGTGTYGVNKADNATFARAGLLMNVKNAYGATLALGYDGHVLNNVIPNLPTDPYFFGKDANDGVRLSFMTISDNYHPGKSVQQTFTYANGQRFLTGGYFNYQLWTGEANTLFTGSYVSPHQLINGSNHGYSNITVTTRNEAGVLLSQRGMVFTNLDDAEKGLSLYKTGYKEYYQEPYTDKQYIKDWELGLPLSITDYDQNGNVQTITRNYYTFSPVDLSSYTRVENVKKLNIDGDLTVKASEAYRPYTGTALLNKTTILRYVTNSSTITDEVTYTYDGKNNLKTITTRDSRGAYSFNNNIYNYDVTSPTGTTLYNMTASGLEKVVSTERWKKVATNPPYNDLLMDASITKYSYQAGKLLTQKQFVLQSLAPILYTTYNGAGGANLYGKILAAYNTTQVDPVFRLTSEVLETDSKGHALEMRFLDKNIYQSMIWDPVSGNMVASVENARYKDIAFTSFESFIYNDPVSYTGNEAIVNGGFTYKHMGLNYPGNAISGKAIYRLSPATYIKSKELTSGQAYTLTFWSKDGVPTFSGVGTTITPVEESQANGWKYYRATFTPAQTGILTFASTPIISVDEVRLFPADALMTNSTYNPLFGTSSSVDPTGRITYFEYDAFGRLVITKDQDGNVVAKKEYHIGQ